MRINNKTYIKLWKQWEGLEVVKRSGKPFKSRNTIERIKNLTINPYTRKPGFEMCDGSIVDCFMVDLAQKNFNHIIKANIFTRNFIRNELKEAKKEIENYNINSHLIINECYGLFHSTFIIIGIKLTDNDKESLLELINEIKNGSNND